MFDMCGWELFQYTNKVNGWLIFSKKLKILIETLHNLNAMIEYKGQGLFLNLKLDPSPL